MAGILEGLRVIEGSAFVAAPLGGMTLAQLGADVIRFDPIGGGLDYHRWPVDGKGNSLFWAGLNKGKRSIQVDFKHPAGQELLTELITRPGENNGIFLTNFPTQGWMSYDNLKRKREDLILVNIMASYQGGSAVDYTVNPGVGFPDITGPEESLEPVNHILPAWDNITGQMAAVGLLAAERHRRLTGNGQLVRIALADVALATACHLGNIAEVMVNNEDRQKVGNYLYGAYGKDFKTSDGRRVMIVALTFRQWKSLVDAMGVSEQVLALESRLGLDLDAEGNRFIARKEITGILEPVIGACTLSQLEGKFSAAGVCWGPYQSFRRLLEEDPACSPQNPMFHMLEQPGIGEYLTPGSPLAFSGAERLPPRPAPILGADTDEILSELLGLDSAEIARLHDRKVVAGPG
jgi:2-methylfumaryl-CoA isomerase